MQWKKRGQVMMLIEEGWHDVVEVEGLSDTVNELEVGGYGGAVEEQLSFDEVRVEGECNAVEEEYYWRSRCHGSVVEKSWSDRHRS